MSKAMPEPNRKRKPRLRKSRRSQRWAAAIVVIAVVLAAVAGWRAYERFTGYPNRAHEGSAEAIVVEVPRGSSFTKVLELLVQAEVIAEDERAMFKLYVLNEGAASKVTAGTHTFRGDMTPVEILEELQRAQPAEEVRVTIPEGKQMLQIAEILADKGLADKDSLVAAMRDPDLLRELGIEAESAEGYLFPDTYAFGRKDSAKSIVTKLIKRHQQVFEAVRGQYFEAAEELQKEFDWDQHEIVTLASIVEKETAVKEERPHIARVFLNRLRFDSFKPKRLETDPTIIYGCTVPEQKSEACQSFEGRIRRIHLRDPDNPYNTYTHEGLPPGPISNPGRAAIEGVLNPRKSRALFFVARNDGTHHFSATRAEHEAAVKKYILGGAVGDGTPQ